MHCLIGCEAGFTPALLRDSLRIGEELQSRGHAVTYSVADPVALAEYAGNEATLAILPAPVLREPPALILKRQTPSGFDDVMATLGFAESGHLQTLSRAWLTQIGLVRPDAIVGLYSPMLWLVGAAVRPTYALGCGQFLPPRLGGSFPRLSASTAPLAAEHVMLANANRMLGELGAPPMTTLTEILARCTELLYGLPALDPYLPLRSDPGLGPLQEVKTANRLPTKRRIAAFLDVYCPNIEALLLGLAGVDDIDFDLFLRGSNAGMRRFLQQQPAIRVWDDCRKLISSIGEMSGLIHHGDHDLGRISLTTGRPQLLLPWSSEQTVFANSISWMGVSITAHVQSSIADNVGCVNSFAKNASLTVSAQHHARQLHAGNARGALEPIVAAIEAGAKSSATAAVMAVHRKFESGTPATAVGAHVRTPA